MIIDWYTVVFQLVNFLVLVFLLRRFLYGPIIRAMEERERKIIEREEEALEKAREADDEARGYRERSEALKSQEEEIMISARAAAEAERRNLAEATRQEIAESRLRWKEAFQREKGSFVRELRRQVGLQAGLVARCCLEDLADANLQRMILDVFIEKISVLPDEEASRLREAVCQGDGHVTVRSAFDMQAEEGRLETSLAEILSCGVTLDNVIEPGLVCGLELEVGGYRVAWSARDYLEGVEEQVLEALGRAEEARADAGWEG